MLCVECGQVVPATLLELFASREQYLPAGRDPGAGDRD